MTIGVVIFYVSLLILMIFLGSALLSLDIFINTFVFFTQYIVPWLILIVVVLILIHLKTKDS